VVVFSSPSVRPLFPLLASPSWSRLCASFLSRLKGQSVGLIVRVSCSIFSPLFFPKRLHISHFNHDLSPLFFAPYPVVGYVLQRFPLSLSSVFILSPHPWFLRNFPFFSTEVSFPSVHCCLSELGNPPPRDSEISGMLSPRAGRTLVLILPSSLPVCPHIPSLPCRSRSFPKLLSRPMYPRPFWLSASLFPKSTIQPCCTHKWNPKGFLFPAYLAPVRENLPILSKFPFFCLNLSFFSSLSCWSSRFFFELKDGASPTRMKRSCPPPSVFSSSSRTIFYHLVLTPLIVRVLLWSLPLGFTCMSPNFFFSFRLRPFSPSFFLLPWCQSSVLLLVIYQPLLHTP